MTERLYYTDSSVLEFDATIVSCEEHSDSCYHTILDRSAFYPTSGGQLHDLGKLNDTNVTDVIESESGEVIHVTSTEPGHREQSVHGAVDATRRMANRQLHTAQHLLSQALFRLVDGVTMSVHLGVEYGGVEIDQPNIDDQMLHRIESMVNEMIVSNTPVEIIFAEGEEIAKLGLRKEPKRSGRLRIIRMGDIECSACGGTHCDNTAQVQLIKLIGTERIRKRTLVKFLAGGQAITDYGTRFDVTNQLSRSLTCSVVDLPDKFDQIQNDNKTLKWELTASRKERLPSIIEHLVSLSADGILAETIDPNLVELGPQLTSGVADQIDGYALLIAGERCFVAVSQNAKLDAGLLMKGIAAQSSIKGGGRGRLAQGGGADPEQIAHYRQLIIRLVSDA